MKLGGSICAPHAHAGEWGELLRASRFAAVPAPIDCSAAADRVRDYVAEAARQGVTIAEVGVWRNTLAPDAAERAAAIDYAQRQLALAEEIGAGCCVNIVGARGPRWDGAYADNYSPDTYEAIVTTVRGIIDAVKPTRTFYTIEPMPWMVPDGPDEYLQLLRDIDRPSFAVHMDFVNMINSPKRFLFANDFIAECFRKLGAHIRSCHIKDVAFDPPMTTVLREVAPGQGQLDYRAVVRTIAAALPADAPVLLEHMETDAQYAQAYDYVAAAAAAEGIAIR